jgi:two-component system response regulator AlgR
MQSLAEANLPLRVLVVDDEELARLRLKSLVGECDEPGAVVRRRGRQCGAGARLAGDAQLRPALLDVQMPGRDGTQLAAELRLRTPAPAIVFVTAHAEHALKAFDLEAVDYLTKPVKRERLQAALRRVAQRLGAPPAVGTVAKPEEEGPVIVVSDRGRIIRVPVGDVLYMKAELKYVTLRTADHTHVLDESLAELESRLGDRFLRVHRNALVARRAVRALERRAIAGENADDGLEGWGVCIAPVNEWLAVSRRQVAAVREALVAAER